MTTDAADVTSLSGREVQAMFALAARWLGQNVPAINAINVFPVPDGDTGFNMSATLDAAVATSAVVPGDAGAVMRAMADGALLGARGNSGVILSQILAGFAGALTGADRLDGERLSSAVAAADGAARRAVADPKPGTILTVLADAAVAGRDAVAADLPLVEVLSATVTAARASVDRTPDLLPILREAGVVDSGGYGLQVILEGCLFYVQGTELPPEPAPLSTAAGPAWAQVTAASKTGNPLGYCTEFVVEGRDLETDELAVQLRRIGESVLVVGGGNIVRVHVHTVDPGAALTLAVRHGSLARVKVDNIDAQHRALAMPHESSATDASCVVAVALGDGFEQLLREYGATVVSGGQTANPSTEEILFALGQAPCSQVILLPNNHNLVATAEQAARISQKSIRILPTTSVPQGIACLLAFNPERTLAENESIMRDASARVRTIEVARAVRSVTVGGVLAAAGEPIALLDGALVASGASEPDVVLASVSLIDGGETATVYYGEGASASDAEKLAAVLRSRWPTLEVDILYGGQPAYQFIVAVE